MSDAAIRKLDAHVSDAALVTAACMLATANLREQALLKIVRKYTCTCSTISTDAADHIARCWYRATVETLP